MLELEVLVHPGSDFASVTVSHEEICAPVSYLPTVVVWCCSEDTADQANIRGEGEQTATFSAAAAATDDVDDGPALPCCRG